MDLEEREDEEDGDRGEDDAAERASTCRASRRSATSGCRSRESAKTGSLIATTSSDDRPVEVPVVVDRAHCSKRRLHASHHAAATSSASTPTCQIEWRLTGLRTPTPLDDDADGGLHRRDDPFLLLRPDPAPHRQREVLGGGALGLGQRARARSRGTPSPAGDGAASRSTRRTRSRPRRAPSAMRSRSGRPDDVHVVDVPGLVDRQLDDVAEAELRVARRRLAPRPVPAGEVREEDAQRRRLDRVEPRVRTDRARTSACRASRGSGACARCRRRCRRCTRRARRRRARRGSSSGRS